MIEHTSIATQPPRAFYEWKFLYEMCTVCAVTYSTRTTVHSTYTLYYSMWYWLNASPVIALALSFSLTSSSKKYCSTYCKSFKIRRAPNRSPNTKGTRSSKGSFQTTLMTTKLTVHNGRKPAWTQAIVGNEWTSSSTKWRRMYNMCKLHY